MKSIIKLVICIVILAIAMVSPASAADGPVMVVGRVYHIEGELLRYVPQEKDWVPMVKDAPFGTEDTLFSGRRGMAELIAPNGTWIRIGNSTQIQFIALEADLSEIDVASGEARFYNKGSRMVIKVTSPFGYVLADPGTVFDFYVGDDSAEVVAVQGSLSFVHSATEAKYDVAAGSPSILADRQQVSSGEGTVDPDWNRWNRAREDYWAAKTRVAGKSVEYLPPSLYDEAYALEENGRWERVPYQGTECWFWRPTNVVVGWSPFTVGRWTDWYGDQTWIPAEPFGYITHHYGNWIYARNHWYWAPPVVSVRAGIPLLNVGFHWSPGRVSWIHTGLHVGWVPLAPHETYYCRRHWGDARSVVVNNINITRININVRNYAYLNRAVVVNRDNFYRVNNYRNVRVTNISRTTIINNYRAAPVVNNTVINNYITNKQRYNYTDVKVNEKPHNTVINRIQQNRTLIHEGRRENASMVQERVKGIPEGRINREARIDQPRITNHIVPAHEVNRPKGGIKLQQREIKKRGEGGAAISPGGIDRPGQPSERSGQPVPPAQRPERVTPASPAQADRPVPPAQRPESVIPARPAQPDRPAPPAQRPERVIPARPAQPDRPAPPAQRPERAIPAMPAQADRPAPPAQKPERVIPARPAQPDKPAPPAQRPERVIPAIPPQPDRPARPTQRPERVIPAIPPPADRPAPPAQRPERAIPAMPAQADRPAPPAQKPERVIPARPAQPDKPAPPAQRPERVIPASPAQPDRPARPTQRPERVIPAIPPAADRPAPPAQRPERVIPAIPAQADRPAPPAQKPERVTPASPPPADGPAPPAQRPERVAPARPEQQEKSVEPGQPAERPDRRMPTRR